MTINILKIGLPPIVFSPPNNIKDAAPTNPRMTPNNFVLLKDSLKIKIPIISVQIGVRLFRSPATELLIWVCAKENRNAGIPLPVRPTATNLYHCDQSISFLCQYTIGAKANDDIPNRKQANCIGSKASNDFLISIKEHPQTILRNKRMIHEILSIGFLFIFINRLQSNAEVPDNDL